MTYLLSGIAALALAGLAITARPDIHDELNRKVSKTNCSKAEK